MQEFNFAKLDIQYILQLINRRRWLLIIPVPLCLIGALIYIFITPPTYESKTVIRVGERRILSRSVERVVPGARGIEQPSLLRRQILEYNNMEQLIEKLNLRNQSDLEPLRQKARMVKLKNPSWSIDNILDFLLVDKLKNSFEIKQTGGQFLEIIAHDKTADGAYVLAKNLSDIFIRSTLNDELKGIRSSLDFSSDQVQIFKDKLEKSEKALEEYKRELQISQAEDYVELAAKIEEADSLISSFDVSVRQKQIQIQKIDKQLAPFLRKLTLPETQEFRSLKKQLISGIQKQSDLSMKGFSWKSGEMVRLNQEIEKLRLDLSDMTSKYVEKNLNSVDEDQINLFITKQELLMEMDIDSKKKISIQELRDGYQAKLQERPTIAMNLNRLEEEVKANRATYNLFLQQEQGANIEQSLQKDEAEYKLQIVEPAQKPIAPIKPHKKLAVLIGLAMGFGIGGGLIFGLEYIDQTYKNIENVELELNLPVLGIVPKLEFTKPGIRYKNVIFRVVSYVLLFIIIIFLVFKMGLLEY